MSLINDALKRASETKQQTGDPPPPVVLNPVEYAVRPNPAFRFLVVLLLAIALGFAIWFLEKWREHLAFSAKLQANADPHPAAAATTGSSAPAGAQTDSRIKVSTDFVIRTNAVPKPVVASGETTSVVPGPAPDSLASVTGTNVSSTNAPDATGRSAAPDEATNSFPKLKLQSIVYRLSNPAVVLNGEMLHVGDSIKEARIVKIDRFEVTLEWHGQTNVLSLPRL